MFPDLAPALDAVAGRLVDLLRLTRDHYEHPALNGSYSLKTVLPTVDAELDHALLDDVQDGLSAQAAYHEAWTRARAPSAARCSARRCSSTAASTPWRWCASRTGWAEPDGRMDYRVDMTFDGRRVPTLADILPERGPLRMLIVGKTPSPASVEAGHYFEGRMGRGLWKRLDEAGLLCAPPGGFADELLVEHGFGVTDLCKVPRPFGDEPPEASTRRAGSASRPSSRTCGRGSSCSSTRGRSTRCSTTPSAGSTRAATASTTT